MTKDFKLTKKDIAGIAILVVFVAFFTILLNSDTGECQIARPGYKCASAKDVMIEHCSYWGEFECNTDADVSLPQVEWYIQNLCNIASEDYQLDCSNLKLACNQITGMTTCPIGV